MGKRSNGRQRGSGFLEHFTLILILFGAAVAGAGLVGVRARIELAKAGGSISSAREPLPTDEDYINSLLEQLNTSRDLYRLLGLAKNNDERSLILRLWYVRHPDDRTAPTLAHMWGW